MSPADRGEFLGTLQPLFAAYGKALSSEQADAYWTFLSDLPLPAVQDGIAAAGRAGGRYLPSVGQIREAVAAASAGVRDTRPHGECEWCEGTGWRYVADRLVRACECSRGQRMRRERRGDAA